MAYVANNESLRRGGVMAFNGDATSAAAGYSSTKYWYAYVTADTAAVVETAAYFDAAASLLYVGDVIEAVMVCNGTPVIKDYVVTATPASGNAHVVIALKTTTAG